MNPRVLEMAGRLTLCGVPEGADALIIAEVARARAAEGELGGVLHIARDDARLSALADALEFFAPEIEIVTLHAWDCLPYDRISPNPVLCARRMETLALLAGPSAGGRVILTTVNAASQRMPSRDVLRRNSFTARIGDTVNSDNLVKFLSENGYVRSSTVSEAGEYAVRGGLVDIFPAGADEPIRLDFFGDSLDGIRRFDPLSQMTTGKEQRFRLVPVSEAPLDEASIARFRAGYRELFGAVTGGDPLYEAVSEGRKYQGMEHWLPLFYDHVETVFDYLPGAFVSLDHLVDESFTARREMIDDYYNARSEQAQLRGESRYHPLAPDRLYLTMAEWNESLEKLDARAFSAYQLPDAANVVDYGARRGRDFAPERNQREINIYDAMRAHLIDLVGEGKRVLIASYSEGSRERLGLVMADHGMTATKRIDHWSEVAALPKNLAGLAVLRLEHGFETADLALITEQDILGDRLIRKPKRSRRAENFIAEASALNEGDYVVHIDHGIGRYEGLETIEISGAPHDCVMIVYAGGDKLFVPVENIDVLSRYGSEDAIVQLDKLGGQAWQSRKSALKQRLKDMAEELMKVAAQRELRVAPKLLPPQGLYDEFCARFPYQETDDQLRAIDDVAHDLVEGKPMDRLICGDVGFGKTEVALRSAFIAALDGKQVAVIAPTTLLVRQHLKSFTERFAGLPVRIEQLSRMVSAKNAKLIKENLASGHVDIVIGTHALLGKGIKFKDLGLLVIDEEQHFGVRHKERLKALREDVHVLTLTATPIPRTLQLAMSGMRGLSIIATPPVDRLAVRTFVMPMDPLAVREALLREHYRGGQSYYVCPRIADLAEIEAFLKEEVPEVKFAVAHGQMASEQLEDVMNAFYDNRFDVLLSTTIIESGIDIPTVNTMIIHRADQFGLAQLYQLRGRIGRSKLRAYAYLTVPPGKPLTKTAEKRLKVLQSLDELGAGFTLASHDLDIRGAGNLLGEEQSGHIKEVGVELYQHLLEEAVVRARSEQSGSDVAMPDEWSASVNLGTAVLIPEAYVSDLGIRLGLYRRIAQLQTPEEIESLAGEMIDRFGSLPAEVESLLKIVSIKQLCQQAGVAKLDAGPRGATVSFHNASFNNPGGLVEFLSKQSGTAKLRPDHTLVLMRDWSDDKKRVRGAHDLIKALAGIAAKAA
ncbi:transcription-repair coupling factor [Emcibacter sp. SYSU 3D8]|uniref:transcription-repair coupling factor n=1 Tax=Emcibacter sp. SYSU 3D8 TaxID=3133969 RepID=UPI0031FED419